MSKDTEEVKEKKKSGIDALKSLSSSIQKEIGKGATFIPGEDGVQDNVEWFELDSMMVSDNFGKGCPKGRMIEIFGPEGGGKTSLCCYIAGQVQKAGGNVGFIDAEHAINIEYAKTFGFDVDKAIFAQPDFGEQGLTIVDRMASSGEIDLIIVDSVAALIPKAELEAEMDQQQMGAQARMMGKAMRKLVALSNQNKCTILWVNQIRMKIGCVAPETKVSWQLE